MTMDRIQQDRKRAEAEGIIRHVHDYCEHRCPLRERCPGMACRLYCQEHEAKDVIAALDAPTWDPPTFGGVILEPTIR